MWIECQVVSAATPTDPNSRSLQNCQEPECLSFYFRTFPRTSPHLWTALWSGPPVLRAPRLEAEKDPGPWSAGRLPHHLILHSLASDFSFYCVLVTSSAWAVSTRQVVFGVSFAFPITLLCTSLGLLILLYILNLHLPELPIRCLAITSRLRLSILLRISTPPVSAKSRSGRFLAEISQGRLSHDDSKPPGHTSAL